MNEPQDVDKQTKRTRERNNFYLLAFSFVLSTGRLSLLCCWETSVKDTICFSCKTLIHALNVLSFEWNEQNKNTTFENKPTNTYAVCVGK